MKDVCPSCNGEKYKTASNCRFCRFKNLKRLKTTHGFSKHNVYKKWINLKNHAHYNEIKMPEKWKSFEGFIEDMGIPVQACIFKKKDKNKPYSKENCYWATLIVYKGEYEQS